MDYIKIKFGDDIHQLESRFEKTIDEMFRSMNPMFTLSERIWKPQMDIFETPDEIVIIAEIAGVNKEDLEIEISAKAVKIHGLRSDPPRSRDATYMLAEIQYGRFERTLYLPAPIDTDSVVASHIDGFLKIQLTKVQLDIPRKIPVEDG